jgi:hypothetical protein
MTFLLWLEFDVLDVVRQNGDPELFVACQNQMTQFVCGNVRGAVYV